MLTAGCRRARTNLPAPRGNAWSHGRGRPGEATAAPRSPAAPAGECPRRCPAAGAGPSRGARPGSRLPPALSPSSPPALSPSFPPLRPSRRAAEHGGAMWRWRYVSDRQLEGFRRYKVGARPRGFGGLRPVRRVSACPGSRGLRACGEPFAPLRGAPSPALPSLRHRRGCRAPTCARRVLGTWPGSPSHQASMGVGAVCLPSGRSRWKQS